MLQKLIQKMIIIRKNLFLYLLQKKYNFFFGNVENFKICKWGYIKYFLKIFKICKGSTSNVFWKCWKSKKVIRVGGTSIFPQMPKRKGGSLAWNPLIPLYKWFFRNFQISNFIIYDNRKRWLTLVHVASKYFFRTI